jgi:RNA polymerase-binding transcription factor DksA
LGEARSGKVLGDQHLQYEEVLALFKLVSEVTAMNPNAKNHLIEIPVGGNGGLVWNNLHSEREDICEAILKDSCTASGADGEADHPCDVGAKNWHRELLQARLRKIDGALDRLMSGSYGNCSTCGKWIEDTKLAFDPAIEFCLSCWEREVKKLGYDYSVSSANQHGWQLVPPFDPINQAAQSDATDSVNLESLAPFDTILVRTLNTDYRILLLDPESGRALVEGGQYLMDPREASVTGSQLFGSCFKTGQLVIGSHMEMWIDEKIVSTSRIQSISVEHGETESIESITATVH